MLLLLLSKYLELKLLGCRLGISLTLAENAKRFSRIGCIILYPHPNSVQEFSLLCILTSSWWCRSFCHFGGYKWHLIVILICTSLMTNDVERLSCSYWSFLCILLECFFKCFAHSLIGLFFLLFRCKCFL